MKFREPVNLTGQKFGDLKVLRLDDSRPNVYFWICVCWCENKRSVLERHLLEGKVTMCKGCEARAKMEKWED